MTTWLPFLSAPAWMGMQSAAPDPDASSAIVREGGGGGAGRRRTRAPACSAREQGGEVWHGVRRRALGAGRRRQITQRIARCCSARFCARPAPARRPSRNRKICVKTAAHAFDLMRQRRRRRVFARRYDIRTVITSRQRSRSVSKGRTTAVEDATSTRQPGAPPGRGHRTVRIKHGGCVWPPRSQALGDPAPRAHFHSHLQQRALHVVLKISIRVRLWFVKHVKG